ncbi:hypothetical protein LguiB_034938 [Lonicera macranthoides]
MAAAASSVRSWRTAFLTLRDETLTSPPTSTLLHHLIFSQSDTLIAAAPHLSPHEVTSDVTFLMELTLIVSDSGGDDDMALTFTRFSHLIYNVSRHVSFEMTSSSWALVLDSFGRMADNFLGKAGMKRFFLGNVPVIRALKQLLETIRCLYGLNQRSCLHSENIRILDFLLSIVSRSQAALIYSTYSSGNHSTGTEIGKGVPQYNSLWEVQTTAFSMIGEVFSRVGASLPVDHWQSTIEVFRKVMDVLASKVLLVEDNVMSRFYTSLLNCLHLVLIDPKGSLSDHVTGLVAALRMFLNYGLSSKQQVFPLAGHTKELSSTRPKSNLEESSKLDCGPYRPPHLRKKKQKNLQPKDPESQSFSNQESCSVNYISSDSDYSDSDGSAKDAYNVCSSKARVAAIVCIQDLCRADPKLFTAQWTMLLPSSDVLQPRMSEPTLSMCLLFDPYLKARIAAASTLATMLDGPASVFLQVAEYRQSSKCGSFTALSSSLGQILMQLHRGILYLIKHETHSGLLASYFKILMLLMSSTPYSRMPEGLLPTIVSSLQARIEEGFLLRSDQTSLLAVAINCLTAALSASPSSLKVKDTFLEELSTEFIVNQGKSGVLSSLFRYSEPVTSPTISFEALQALRAVAHNYPNIMVVCWERMSAIVYGYLGPTSPGVPSRWKRNVGNNVGTTGEKVITAAIKVLDDCLRAISGFKGTEDLLDDKLHDNPFTSDYVKMKTISSAPSYGSENSTMTTDEPEICQSGVEQWCEAIEKHMPLILWHTSPMVRAASVTCFAGITSSVFFSLPKEKQDFILINSINAALNDEVPSVRSAACRAIGVIACLPQISQSAEILDKFIHAVEINTRDPLVSVRITASWALANICDSLRHCIHEYTSKRCSVDSKGSSHLISLLIESALRLTKDGDKIKANAVRALGNLSRCVQLISRSSFHYKPVDDTGLSLITNSVQKMSASNDPKDCQGEHLAPHSFQPPLTVDSHWLERMVQAFLSCVTTGNVKVQWNVCHALSNLFLNGTLRLQDMDWAPSVFSILLLLLRDASNFKIRIQAATALAVPATILDYGRSFSDVVQGVEHILENLSSDQISTPSSFKYRIALEKQVTSTMLHVLGLASGCDHPLVKDFLAKKASFLLDWLKTLCSSLRETSSQLDTEQNSTLNQKKEVISKAIKSLVEVYESRNHHNIARSFNALGEIIQ